MLEGLFSFATHLFLLVSLPFLLDTGVSLDKCPSKHRTGVREVKDRCLDLSYNTHYKPDSKFHACILAKPTFPHFQEESVCLLFFLQFELKLHSSSHMAANVPENTITTIYFKNMIPFAHGNKDPQPKNI